MDKDKQKVTLIALFLIVAIFSGLILRLGILKMLPISQIIKRDFPISQNTKESLPFPVDAYGVYILPTVNPTYTLLPGVGAVGGKTACERLDRLRTCLTSKNSTLSAVFVSPAQTEGKSIEEACGETLVDLSIIRPQSVAEGCIF